MLEMFQSEKNSGSESDLRCIFQVGLLRGHIESRDTPARRTYASP